MQQLSVQVLLTRAWADWQNEKDTEGKSVFYLEKVALQLQFLCGQSLVHPEDEWLWDKPSKSRAVTNGKRCTSVGSKSHSRGTWPSGEKRLQLTQLHLRDSFLFVTSSRNHEEIHLTYFKLNSRPVRLRSFTGECTKNPKIIFLFPKSRGIFVIIWILKIINDIF